MTLWKRLFGKQKPAPEWTRGLTSQSIAIDCGANIGAVTLWLARTGATVYAFEPNPHAFEKLEEKTREFPQVTCFQEAVGAAPGLVKLYMHQNAREDPVFWSTGSSMLEFKRNINPSDFTEVKCIDLCAFIQSLPRPVDFLKIDVEGVECEILEKLFQTGLIGTIGRLYCEMHDEKIEALREPSERIRRYVADHQLSNVDLTWH